jgi:TrmH family RNA methyltransferase
MEPDVLTITSLQNPRVKNLVKLRRKRTRDQQGLLIIDEPLVIRRALEAGWPFETIFFCPERLTEGEESDLWEALQSNASGGLELVRLSEPVLNKISYGTKPRGLLVVAKQKKRSLADLFLPPNPLIIVLEGVEKPGNLGAVLRCADGAGADAVLLCGTGTDIYNPNVLRASRGTVFSVPTVQATSPEIAEFLAARQIRRVATTPQAQKDYTDCDLTGPLAIVVGAEDRGLSQMWLDLAEERTRIPLHGKADSLNLAISAALLLYEAVRQRR